MRNHEHSRGSRSIPGTTRLGVLLPVLCLGAADGSEHTFLGRGRPDSGLGGGGARVGLFLAAWLIVSMTDDDWRDSIELGVLGRAGAISACPGTVGEATESTWSNDWAHETALSVVALSLIHI